MLIESCIQFDEYIKLTLFRMEANACRLLKAGAGLASKHDQASRKIKYSKCSFYCSQVRYYINLLTKIEIYKILVKKNLFIRLQQFSMNLSSSDQLLDFKSGRDQPSIYL